MSPQEASKYKQGDALRDVQNESAEDGQPAPPPGETFIEDEEVYGFSEEEHWTWLISLMEDGGQLNKYLDDLLDRAYTIDPPFYSFEGRRKLLELLNELKEARHDVRAYEHDVEELTFVFSKSQSVETQAASGAELALENVKTAYTRAYDMCLYKLDRMSDGWITATNLLISLTILIVTILFWMEFR